MKRLFLILFGIMSLVSATGLAQETDTVEFGATSRMISYQDFLRLRPANREIYLNELRVLLMEMEEYQDFRGQVQPTLFKRDTVGIDYMTLLFDYAFARGLTRCDSPKVIVTDQQGRRFCTTKQFERYIRGIQEEAALNTWRSPMRPGTNTNQSLNRVLPSNFRVAPGSTFSPAHQRYIGRQTPQPVRTANRVSTGTTNATVRAPARTQVRAPASPQVPQQRQGQQRQGNVSPTKPRRSLTAVPEVQPRDIPDIESVATCSRQQADVPVTSGLKCNAETVNAARARFRGQRSKSCVYAGHLRRYRNDEAQPGQCQPINKWCIENSDPEDCQVPTDQAQSFKPVFSCPVSQVLCNPVLFGVKMDKTKQGQARFQPFCVSKSSSATAACYASMDATRRDSIDTTEHLDLNNLQKDPNVKSGDIQSRILGEALEELQLSPEDQQRLGAQLAQLPRMWDQLAEGLTNMCINDNVERQVFCEECYHIRLRLSEMGFLTSDRATSACTKIRRDLKYVPAPGATGATIAGVVGSLANPTVRVPASPTTPLPGDPKLRPLPVDPVGVKPPPVIRRDAVQ